MSLRLPRRMPRVVTSSLWAGFMSTAGWNELVQVTGNIFGFAWRASAVLCELKMACSFMVSLDM